MEDTSTAVREGEVDPQAVERLKEQEAEAVRAGFAIAPPVYALGTRVVAVGAENFRRSRAAFESLPRADAALRKLGQRVAAEKRQDDVVDVATLRMLPDGLIAREGGSTSLALNPHSFRQLMFRAECPEASAAATYLAAIPAARRALEVNAWLKHAPSKSITVRHRDTFAGEKPELPREAFAIVSERYTPHDVDTLAAEMGRAIVDDLTPGDARCEVEYDGSRAVLTLVWHSDIQPETCAAGEIFRAVAGIRSADDGSGSVIPFAGLTRNLCLNLIILDQSEQSLGKRRHTGEGVATFLAESLKAGVDKVRWFANRWDAARRSNLRDVVAELPESRCSDVELTRGIFRGLLADRDVSVPGYRAQTKGTSAVDVLQRAYDVEPEPTIAGIVNAVTRAAHTADLKGAWATDDLQKAGAALLTRKRQLRWVGEEVAL